MYYVKENGSVLTNSAVEYLTFNANGRYTSGNATLDSYVDQALAACTNSGMTKAQKLRAAYLYVRDHAHTLPVRIRQEAQRLGRRERFVHV